MLRVLYEMGFHISIKINFFVKLPIKKRNIHRITQNTEKKYLLPHRSLLQRVIEMKTNKAYNVYDTYKKHSLQTIIPLLRIYEITRSEVLCIL